VIFLSFPSLDTFYIDRIWLKAYPDCFAYPNDPLCKAERRIWREMFPEMTERAFRIYRSIRCIQLAIRKGYDVKDLERKKCLEIMRYGKGAQEGEEAFADFYYDSGKNGFAIHWADGRFETLSLDTIKGVMLMRWVDTGLFRRGIRAEHKFVYIPYRDWLRIAVFVHGTAFRPPLIRIFYNPLIRAKEELKIGDSGYESHHKNFVDPDSIDLDRFLELNRRFAEDKGYLKNEAYREWEKWFGDIKEFKKKLGKTEFLVIKVTQIELARDMKKGELDIITGLHFVAGTSRTIKFSVSNPKKYEETVIGSFERVDPWEEPQGVKYYVTVRKGFQVKAYLKAWRQVGDSFDLLYRVEYTKSVNESLEEFRLAEVLKDPKLIEVHRTLALGTANKDQIEKLKEILRPIVKCRTRCDDHYAFLIKLLIAGSIKGSGIYRAIARIYEKYGVVEIVGRGRHSVIRLSPAYLGLRESIEAVIGKFESLELDLDQKPQQKR